VSEELPPAVRLMLRAGEFAGVGPFAAVAGTIAQLAAEAALDAGARNVVIENGGDIALAGERNFRVGIFAGEASFSGRLALEFFPDDLPAGACTSSGKVGHSISVGDADAVTVIADEASIADAAATAIANEVQGSGEEPVKRGLRRARRIRGVRGCIILKGSVLGAAGDLPKLVPASPESVELANVGNRYWLRNWE